MPPTFLQRAGAVLVWTLATWLIDVATIGAMMVLSLLPGPMFTSETPAAAVQIQAVVSLIFAPLFETALLAFLLHWLRKATSIDALAVVGAALAMALLHIVNGPTAPLFVFGGFVLQAALYLQRRRPPCNDAFWIVAAVHALGNLLPATVNLLRFGGLR